MKSQVKKPQLEHIISERLKICRRRLGLTQQGLAGLTGFSLSAIGNWESFQNVPSPSKLGHLARKLEVSIDYLLGNEDGPPSPHMAKGDYPDEFRAVPIVSWAQAGELKAYTDIDPSWQDMTPTTCRDENCFAVYIAGDSMEPKYNSGDVAILMPTVEPRNGCLVVAKLKNEGVFFKLFSQPDKSHFRLSSYNSVYQPMECPKSDFIWIYPVFQIVKNVWR